MKGITETFFEIDAFYTEVSEYDYIRVIDRIYYKKGNEFFYINVGNPDNLYETFSRNQYAKNHYAILNLRMSSHISVECDSCDNDSITISMPIMHTEIKNYVRKKIYEMGFRGTIKFIHLVKSGEYILM